MDNNKNNNGRPTLARGCLQLVAPLFTALWLGLFAVQATAQAAQSDERIRLGTLFSMTGPSAASGLTGLTATRMAVAEINAAGGILGRQVDILVADDASNPTQAVSETKRLISRERIQLLVGPTVSQYSMAIGPLLAEARIASIYLSGSAALTPQVTPTGFSLYTSVDATAQTMLEYAANVRRAKSVALLTDTGAQGKASQQAFKDKVDGLGLRLTGIQEHEPHAQDLVAQLLSLRRGAPELILHVSSLGDDLGQLMTSLDQLGWEVPVASNVAGINVPMVLRVAGPGAYRKGNLAGVMLKAYTYCPGEPVGETEFGRFVGRLKAFAPQNFDKLNMQVVSMSYDSVFVLKEAVEATQSLDGPTLAAWLEEHASTIEGRVNGQLTASPSSHFLIGSDSLVMAVRPDQQRADGLVLREGCPQSGPQ